MPPRRRHNYTHDVVSIRLGGCLHKDDKDWTRRIGNERHLVRAGPAGAPGWCILQARGCMPGTAGLRCCHPMRVMSLTAP